ncbi:hypothetical protein FA10DRAFT_286562 [Acaromyces ingoldii]|uniref:Enhancer of mRNA-decapping protein 4 WD40 repeat region domain-containing protein n=1 Tax=Acaromyces ingoldii TaxID=215250 RepID=A0A316YMW4_9BASI|nr:hypothetical protein FA10DRAFT_286562 [Acaromyces ingoldii]PWN90890.1 hypothetical protein FA10DRAFT_286562 [Acaromyces ingoldii]
MASNSLLALLNLSSASSTPSAKATAKEADQEQPPSSSSAQVQFQQTTSSTSSPSANRGFAPSNDAADSLLALLTGGGKGQGVQTGDFQTQSSPAPNPISPPPQTPSTAPRENGNDAAAARKIASSAAPTETASLSGASAQPQTPSMFDFVSPFDLLEKSRKPSAPSTPSAAARATSSESATRPPPPQKPVDSPSVAQEPSKTNVSVESKAAEQNAPASLAIDRSMHANRHLSGLHASSGFDDAISSGYSTTEQEGLQTHVLQLSAPQPGGANTLHPAKLDIVPVSLIETAFSPQGSYHGRGLWPQPQVAGLGGRIVAYVMKKGKIRLLDELSGERALARTDPVIKSIFSAPDERSDKAWTLAALTEAGVSIWSLDRTFGQGKGIEPRLIARLPNQEGAPIVYAIFRPASGGRELLLVHADGLVVIAESNTGRTRVVAPANPSTSAACFSSDGSIVAVLEARDHSPLILHLHHADEPESGVENIELPFGVRQISNVGHLSFLTDAGSVRAAAVGFNNNTTLAVFDLAKGQCRQLFDFSHRDDKHFNLVSNLARPESTLFVSSSLRASFFSIRIDFGEEGLQKVDSKDAETAAKWRLEQGEVVDQHKELSVRRGNGLLPFANASPTIKECALPEPYTSFDVDVEPVDDTVGGGIRVVALHPGGTHVARVPREALAAAPTRELGNVGQVRQEKEEEDLATHGNVVAEPTGEAKPIEEELPIPKEQESKRDIVGEEKPWEQEVMANADALEVPTGPALNAAVNGVTKESKRAGETEKKKKDRRSKAASRNNDSRAATPTLFDRSGSDAPSSSSVSNEDLRKLIQRLESQQLAPASSQQNQQQQQPQAQSPAIGPDAARLIAQNIAPHLDSVARELLQQEVHRGVEKAVSESIATEMHSLVMRPDISNHLARSISQSILPTVQRTAMDVVTRALAPHFEDVMNSMVDRIERRIEGGMTSVRKDIVTEQSAALLQSEASLRDMARQMSELSAQLESVGRSNAKLERSLADIKEEQKVLALNAVKASQNPQNSTKSSSGHHSGAHHASQTTSTSSVTQEQPPRPQVAQTEPLANAPAPPSSSPQDLEDVIVSALSSGSLDTDMSPLVSTLAQLESRFGSAHGVLWSVTPGKPSLSQPVLLALVHRIANSLKAGFVIRNNISTEQAVPWIEACLAVLDKQDPAIQKFVQHAAPAIAQALVEAHSRLASQGVSLWWSHERLVQGSLRYLQL